MPLLTKQCSECSLQTRWTCFTFVLCSAETIRFWVIQILQCTSTSWKSWMLCLCPTRCGCLLRRRSWHWGVESYAWSQITSWAPATYGYLRLHQPVWSKRLFRVSCIRQFLHPFWACCFLAANRFSISPSQRILQPGPSVLPFCSATCHSACNGSLLNLCPWVQ